MKIFASFLFLVICASLCYSDEYALARARAAFAFSSVTIDVQKPVPVAPTWPKNGHNLQTNTVWRETLPNDGQRWWKEPDPNFNVFWRYLRPNENPETLTVPLMQGVFSSPIRSSANC